MKQTREFLAAVVVSCLAVSPAMSADAPPNITAVQIAENTPEAATAETRNVTATRRTDRPDIVDESADESPAAKALMALGIALMSTPDMFGGAFSN